jgi:hypothetical protein
MAAPEATSSVSAANQVWQVALDRLATSTDCSELAVVLSLVAELETADLPITELTHLYVRMAQHVDADASLALFRPDVDEEILTPCHDLLEGAPERLPIDTLVVALRSAYSNEESDDEVQGRIQALIQCLEGEEIDLTPFLALLQDAIATIRCGGLDALYYLGRADGMAELLHDPVPQVRALAIENLGYLDRLPEEQVQEMAATDPDAGVREMAQHWLANITKVQSS